MKKRKESGFTIIEVLIVLAIAGLILLVVFLAVPALQRNSRNTQRKSDISALAGAINEFESNNGGAVLKTTDVTSTTSGTGASATTTLGGALTNVKLGFYTAANVFAGTSSSTPTTAVKSGTASATVVTPDSVTVWIGFDCSAGSAAAPVAGSSRSVALEYAVETGGGVQTECSQS